MPDASFSSGGTCFCVPVGAAGCAGAGPGGAPQSVDSIALWRPPASPPQWNRPLGPAPVAP
eukprot:6082593-Lingulodinium_polyedra.AAC.1